MDDNHKSNSGLESNISTVLTGIAEKLKSGSGALSVGAEKGRNRLDRLNAKRDIDKLYWKLGKEIVALVQAGEIVHPGVKERAKRIEQLISKLNSEPTK
jgi:hypothetical protein